MAIVIFWPVYFSPLVVTWRKLYTIVCLGACDKLVSFLCVVFVSEEYSREYKKESFLVIKTMKNLPKS